MIPLFTLMNQHADWHKYTFLETMLFLGFTKSGWLLDQTWPNKKNFSVCVICGFLLTSMFWSKIDPWWSWVSGVSQTLETKLKKHTLTHISPLLWHIFVYWPLLSLWRQIGAFSEHTLLSSFSHHSEYHQ